MHDPSTQISRRECPQYAFTLVELVIAMTIFTLLGVMLFSILSATSDLWKNNEEAVSSFREARAALNVMARDVAQSFDDPIGQIPTIIINPTQAVVTQPSEAVLNTSWGQRFFLLSTFAADAQESGRNRSDLCALGYYLAYTRDTTSFSTSSTSGSAFSYKLYRHFQSSDATFAALSNALTKGATPGDPDSYSPKKIYLPIISSTTTGDEILARNVNQLRLRVFERTIDPGTGQLTGFQEFDLSSGVWPVGKRPAMIEITLSALPDKAAAKLPDQAAWDNHTSPLQLREAREFVTRITIP